MRIEEGRLVRQVCPHCGNVEWRAFGESESKRGELASYALGWTSGHEDVVGHMTIGIGAGNPDGGSFHVEIRMVDDSWAMGLVDEPFEDVPEGGRDLTREEALAHVDIDYVWFVADNVMLQDRRAWWLEHYLRGTEALAARAVAGGSAPVRRVLHDRDGTWRLLDGGNDDDLREFPLFRALDDDQTLLDVLDLKNGRTAERQAPGRPWKRRSRFLSTRLIRASATRPG